MLQEHNLNTLNIPWISIITVVYNGAKYLESTIQSVAKQEYPNIEYIVIDGGSTDGTIDILRKHESKIAHWISQSDEGIYDAMNKAWEIARYDSYILFLGAGDRIITLPKPEELMKMGDAVIGSVLNGNFITRSRVDWSAKLRITIHHQSLLIRKSVSPTPPFNIKYKICGDHDFNIRLIKQGIKFNFSDSLVAYAMPGGVSENLGFSEWGEIVKNHFGLHWMLASFTYYLLIKSRLNIILRKLLPSLALNKYIDH